MEAKRTQPSAPVVALTQHDGWAAFPEQVSQLASLADLGELARHHIQFELMLRDQGGELFLRLLLGFDWPDGGSLQSSKSKRQPAFEGKVESRTALLVPEHVNRRLIGLVPPGIDRLKLRRLPGFLFLELVARAVL